MPRKNRCQLCGQLLDSESCSCWYCGSSIMGNFKPNRRDAWGFNEYV